MPIYIYKKVMPASAGILREAGTIVSVKGYFASFSFQLMMSPFFKSGFLYLYSIVVNASLNSRNLISATSSCKFSREMIFTGTMASVTCRRYGSKSAPIFNASFLRSSTNAKYSTSGCDDVRQTMCSLPDMLVNASNLLNVRRGAFLWDSVLSNTYI